MTLVLAKRDQSFGDFLSQRATMYPLIEFRGNHCSLVCTEGTGSALDGHTLVRCNGK